MAVMIEQIHIRVGEDRELFTKINELLRNYPDRFENQSHVCRAAINYMHRELMREKHDRERTRI